MTSDEMTHARLSEGGGGRLAPCDVFEVPQDVRYLDAEALERLERSFRRWCAQAGRPDRERSRLRVLCLFLMLRHSGAKLGEVLGMDEGEALDPQRAVVLLGREPHVREVPLPRAVCRELTGFLASPLGAGLRGSLFSLDPGYVRRMFYARAEDCGLPRELGAPNVLRRSRAVEMLRSGVPLGVVREVLGQSSADLVAVFQRWSEGDVQGIVRRLAVQDAPVRSSARNTFRGRVTWVRKDGVMAEVALETAAGLCVRSVITLESFETLGIAVGVSVVATVKAPYVDVLRGTQGGCNRIAVTVSGVRGNGVLSEVSAVGVDGTNLCALVCESELEGMPIAPGDRVIFAFKALSVVLHTL
ncbi:molybdate transport system regulatory protein [Desulfobaculum xiamenense]|uniref:Molybdate transport system regulatory protein n=1 Tax=Desulfobaculum xiamenense TaxID=995050 RepID=A0A846QJX2_9BACT|nr:TOBE domain-containing protein [Desulfobaculum xiamenense]NJB66473.1 molybdate transport system regulatory protein [Desulfobaculum xiamenense]